jgi:hypothetical protein
MKKAVVSMILLSLTSGTYLHWKWAANAADAAEETFTDFLQDANVVRLQGILLAGLPGSIRLGYCNTNNMKIKNVH